VTVSILDVVTDEVRVAERGSPVVDAPTRLPCPGIRGRSPDAGRDAAPPRSRRSPASSAVVGLRRAGGGAHRHYRAPFVFDPDGFRPEIAHWPDQRYVDVP
jgi:hypothetical protein